MRLKRILDAIVSISLLLVFSPVLLLTALAVAAAMGRPIMFRQKRAGLHGREFVLLKYRTMRQPRESIPDEARITALGRLLRNTSLDELPQLWNVAKGDMSLVGPRPLLASYLDRYTTRQRRRHEVRPGLTGWVQVNGRNSLDWEEKFNLDVWYVEHRGFFLDLKILLLTVPAVFRKVGIGHSVSSVMPEYLGVIARDRKN
ncbi:MAG TPA: sugar transferase [Bryobacteraceae bacterium]|nr:sugar transferase [Bryobacteraceae bacterium]